MLPVEPVAPDDAGADACGAGVAALCDVPADEPSAEPPEEPWDALADELCVDVELVPLLSPDPELDADDPSDGLPEPLGASAVADDPEPACDAGSLLDWLELDWVGVDWVVLDCDWVDRVAVGVPVPPPPPGVEVDGAACCDVAPALPLGEAVAEPLD